LDKIKYTCNPFGDEQYQFHLRDGASYLFKKVSIHSRCFHIYYYPRYNAKFSEAERVPSIEHIAFRHPELANLLFKNIDIIESLNGYIVIPDMAFYTNILSCAEERKRA